MSQRQWHYMEHEDQVGPVDEQELRRLLEEGPLPWEAYVWTAGMDDWRQAKELPDLGGTAPEVPDAYRQIEKE